MAIHIGDILKNRYKIVESLGRGGMAEVYKVWDTQRGAALAMKVLRDDLAEDIVFMRRFEREAHNLTKLQHPNIVRCYGLEREGRTAFMLMDYIEGGTLRSEIFDAHAPLSTQRILEVIQPVCSALNYAHQMGVVHCDVKSANIMLHKNGTIYLTDFGIARGMDAATSTMVGVGTPAYMAPELIKGEDPTPQTDIYALGIVLYEMLTGGERPFTGERATITGTTAEKVRWEHLKLNPIPISSYNPLITQDIERIILKCIEKNRVNRFRNIQDVLLSIEQVTHEQNKISNGKNNISEQLRHPSHEERAFGNDQENAHKQSSIKTIKETNQGRRIISNSFGLLCTGFIVIALLFIFIYRESKTATITFSPQATYTTDTPSEVLREHTYTYISPDRGNNIDWECVYQVQLGDVLVQIFDRFDLNYSLEQDSLYYYEHCEFNGSNFTCSEQRQLIDPNLLYAEVWLIINSHEEKENEWDSESCLSGGGFIHFLTNLEETQSPNSISIITPEYEIGSNLVFPVDGMRMVYVPAGNFEMGSNDGYDDEKPVHSVWLDAFWIDQTEVTNGMYEECVAEKVCDPQDNHDYTNPDTGTQHFNSSAYSDYPAVYVNWEQANDYCAWAGRRLPTEAEWEKAAKGDTFYSYPWGNSSPNSNLANFNDNIGDTVEVGSYPDGASMYGALDMAGNVWEWVNDWYNDTYYKSSPGMNPQGPSSGTEHVLRGGSFSILSEAKYLRVTYRSKPYPSSAEIYGSGNWGFRCAMDVD
jgi:serine/threonine protein kinase/formylglycine-generating enzyme required for sulfatase activity